MSQIFASSAALLLALLIWGLGKKPRNFALRKNYASLLEDINQPDISLIQKTNFFDPLLSSQTSSSAKSLTWEAPKTKHEQIALQKVLRSSFSGGPEQRLNAVRLAKLWGHPSVLPILRQGLKDSDSQVVETAAEALQKFRGKPGAKNLHKETGCPPRNVALMR